MKFALTLITFLLLSGCSANRMWYGSDVAILTSVQLEGIVNEYGEVVDIQVNNSRNQNAPVGSKNKHLGALISWSPEFNAAFISQSGNGCIQPATYSKLNSGGVSIPTEIISSDVSGKPLSGNFSQALEKLISVSDQATFLSIGVYGLCQLHANGGLSDEQLKQLTEVLFEKAAAANGAPVELPKQGEAVVKVGD